MTPPPGVVLERLPRANGLGWLIDSYSLREHAVSALLERLSRVEPEYRERIVFFPLGPRDDEP